MNSKPNWLRELRHELHTLAEVSGAENNTAARIIKELKRFKPDELYTSVGGTGVIAVFHGLQDGIAVGFRAELDALPIYELSDVSYRSQNDGVSHLCGHDGHMCMVLALAEQLAEQRPQSGSVALVFQPAEETGQGAKSFLQDPKFSKLDLDYLFSLHNAPGVEMGKIQIPSGAANCASRGIKFVFSGKTSHAATPADGLSPMQTISRLMPALNNVASPIGGVQSYEFSLITVTHATLGKPTFGVAPGFAEIWATLRTRSDPTMEMLCAQAESLAVQAAKSAALDLNYSYQEVFEACENTPEAVDKMTTALQNSQISFETISKPQLWSEDFGQFSAVTKTAMFWLGSGDAQPQLHSPTYDFPDEILGSGTRAFQAIIDELLN